MLSSYLCTQTNRLSDRIHGSLATARRLLNRACQYSPNLHRPSARNILMARHYLGRLSQPTRVMDIPSLFCILRLHRFVRLDSTRRSQIRRLLLRWILRHGLADSLLMGQLDTERELRRKRSYYLIHDDAGIL